MVATFFIFVLYILKKFVIIFLLCSFSIVGNTQQLLYIDSINFQNFHKYDSSLIELNFGSAIGVKKDLFFNLENKTLSNSPFFYKEAPKLPLFHVGNPIVDVKYILGSSQEQMFSIFHTQNINREVNYAVLYKKSSYSGYYQNQATNHNLFQSSISYNPDKKDYSANLYYNHHRYFHEQNGGIKYDSVFSQDIFFSSNRLLVDVNLKDAYSKDILNTVGVTQQLIINKKVDSIGIEKLNKINLDFILSQQSKVYFDSLSDNFYAFSFIDTNSTYDTLLKNTFVGDLSYSIIKKKDSVKSNFFKTGIEYVLNSHKNSSIDTVLYNLDFNLEYGQQLKEGYFKVNGKYFFSGYRAEDYALNSIFNKNINKTKIILKAEYSNVTPAYELIKYYGNHSYWANSFLDQQFLCLSGGIQYNNWLLTSTYNDIYNPIYYNYLGVPHQTLGVAQVIHSSLSNKWNFNGWKIHPSINYQYQGGLDIYRLP